MTRRSSASLKFSEPTRRGTGMPSARSCVVVLAAMVTFIMVPTGIARAGAGVESLTVDIEGFGAGQVVSYTGSPPIECSYEWPGPPTGVCETTMNDEGDWEQIHLEAVAAPGSEFVGWSVKNSEFEGCGTLTICAPYVEPPGTGSGTIEVTAVFECEPDAVGCSHIIIDNFGRLLTIVKEGEGAVVGSPGVWVECGATTCDAEIEEGLGATLTAIPASGWAFGSWTGCAFHVGLTCTVGSRDTLKAKFYATPALTVEKAGSGSGKVIANGISCDASCSVASSAVKAGGAVKVKAIPSRGSEVATFEGGTGNASGCTGGSCEFTITEDSSIAVKFDPIPTKDLTVNLTGPGAYKGTVKGRVLNKEGRGLLSSALACSYGCASVTETFLETAEVEVTALAAPGYTFEGWGTEGAGTCTGTTTPCTLSTDADKTLTAKFK